MGACMSYPVDDSGDDVANSASAIVATTVEGSHFLKIDGYSLTKGMGTGKYIKSKPFDIGGHQWCIRYYPDGKHTRNAGWISMYLELVLNPNNNATGAKAEFEFSLLDDVGEPVWSSCGSSGRSIHTFTSSSKAWGYGNFIETKALEESNSLNNDCFRVRCDVIVSQEIRTEATTQFVTVPPSEMARLIGGLLLSGVEGDVTFQVGDETFAAHRLVLGARSSVFMSELLGPMKERNGRVVRIDDVEPRVFGAMLYFIYTDEFPEMDDFAMAQHLLVAADRYGLERLKLMCEQRLCECLNTSMATSTLVPAEQHGCKGLKEACFKFLKSPGHLKTIMDDADEFQYLTSSCPSILSELLANVCTLT